MKKTTPLILLLLPLASTACVNPNQRDDTQPREAAATDGEEAIAEPIHGWPESNG